VSFKWPNKDPDEVVDYSIDWSRYLDGATITSYAWFVDDASGTKTAFTASAIVNGIQNVGQSASGGVVTLHLGAGTNNTEYKFYSRITDSTGTTAERVIKLRVKEQ
jgi:hypothetical protein